MAIDDPLDAAEQRLAAEERASSPLSRFIRPLVELGAELTDISPGLLPEPSEPALKAAGFLLSKREENRREYLVACLIDEVRRIRGQIERVDEDHSRFVKDQWLPLFLDGLQKAEQTINQQRIRRIAAILAHSLEAGPSKSTEIAEEMMRIAMLLSDEDVLVLRTIYEGQNASYNSSQGRVGFEAANDFWRLLDPTHRRVNEPELTHLRSLSYGALQGICAKLQSFGLLAQVNRNNSKLSPDLIPYAILTKAVEFVEYVRTSP
jgi:hypothetical protein